MKGIIGIWSGAIVNIPGGWQLCDGTNGTPDLRNLFVVGAGDSFNPDDSGGALTHTHDFTGDGHFHTMAPPTDVAADSTYRSTTSTDPAVGTTDADGVLPPYYALAFIQKM